MKPASREQGWQLPSGWPFVVLATALRPVMLLTTSRTWQGVENIPQTGAVIVAVNHTSVVDPLLVAHLLVDRGRIPRFLGKSELFAWPVVGWAMRATGQIPVNRNRPDAAQSLIDALAALAAGECVVIYPEGTVTLSPGLWPMRGHTGVARLAALSGAPVVPVAVWGAHRILGKDRRPRLFDHRARHKISILVGPPVDLDITAGEGESMRFLHEATGEVMAAITSALEQVRGESVPHDPLASA